MVKMLLCSMQEDDYVIQIDKANISGSTLLVNSASAVEK